MFPLEGGALVTRLGDVLRNQAFRGISAQRATTDRREDWVGYEDRDLLAKWRNHELR